MHYYLKPILAFVVCLAFTQESLSQEKATADGTSLFSLTVSAGEQNRENAVVQVPVSADLKTEVVTLHDNQGNTIIGQISAPSINQLDGAKQKRLTFVLPKLAANQSLELTAREPASEPDRKFAWHDDYSTSAQLQFGDVPVMSYMYESLDDSTKERIQQTYKVYHHVFTPDGSRLMTKGPGGLFPHHRGLFYGFNRITYGQNQKADVWHCKNGATQSHESAVTQVAGPVMGRDVNRIFWRGEDGKPFAKELREMTAYKIGEGTLIEFNSILETVVGPIQLKGDPQHAGFQFRASQDVPDKTKAQTYYIRPDGKGEPGKFRNWSGKPKESEINRNHVDLPWNAVSIVLPAKGESEKRFTVCYLDHPSNPKPARFSERDYGRFGSYFEYEITKDNPLQVRYQVWVQEGEMSVAQVQALSDLFVDPVKGVVKE